MKSLSKIVKGTFSRISLKANKYAPDILLGFGVVGVVAATVIACKQTTKAAQIAESLENELETIKTVRENPEVKDYSESDYCKELSLAYIHHGLEFAKTYAVAAGLGTASIGLIFASHHILKKRQIALVAAYTGLQRAFCEYRDRVVAKEGPEADRKYIFGLDESSSEVAAKDEKEGPDNRREIPKVSGYARFFDQASRYWSKSSHNNFMFLKSQQNYFNDLLDWRGHVFLNEVYDALGLPHTKEGAVVGWIKGHKDGYIDFNIWDEDDERKVAFINGDENVILLDFNVDGVIYDLI